jgi:hypothetical protein
METTFSKPTQPEVDIDDSSIDSGIRAEGKTKVEPAFSIYKQVNKIPYTAKYFNVERSEIPMINGTLNRIEDYVKSQIERRGLEDTLESYNNVMQEIFEAMGMEKTLRSDIRLDKIVKFLELLNRNYGNVSKSIRPNSNA